MYNVLRIKKIVIHSHGSLLRKRAATDQLANLRKVAQLLWVFDIFNKGLNFPFRLKSTTESW